MRKDERLNNENIFTVIVGKNGTGKSTLLSSIVANILSDYSNRFYSQHEIGLKNYEYKDFKFDVKPQCVIAVSSSPFDKFPIPKKVNDIQSYNYLGLRDLTSFNFGLSYMAKIISSLIDLTYNNPYQWNYLSDVLKYLGYRDIILTKFIFNLNKNMINEMLKEESIGDGFLNNSNTFRNLSRRYFIDEYGVVDVNKIIYLKSILFNLINDDSFKLNKLIEIKINGEGVNIEKNYYSLYDERILFLINAGVLKLKDVNLFKLNTDFKYSIKDSSSGEQSVILSILGIASKIQNNSVICIDEPEVCLHPEWQERYIQILINTFNKFYNCHFIIATHSPQIISNLNPKNCYIVSMEDAAMSNANLFVNNSIDFQLANIFKSPGFKNEYLGRLAFTIFSKVSKNKKFDIDDINNYKVLKEVFDFLNDNDPIKELISVIKELHNRYA